MKVAIIDPLGGHGGLHYFTDGLASGLQNAGVETTVFTVRETGKTGREPYRVILAFAGLYGEDLALIRGVRFVRGIVKSMILARIGGCELVHMHCFHGNAIEQITAVLSGIFGMKLMVTLHDVETFGSKGASSGRDRVLDFASAVTVLNGFCRDEFRRVTTHRRRTPPVFVIPSGNYIGNFPDSPGREAARMKLGIASDRTVLLFFGNSREEKGLDLLLRAMTCFRSDAKVQLIVAGKMKPDQERRYRQIIVDSNVGGIVRMDVGHVADEDTPAYYTAANLVVVPYRRIYDSAVTLMAMSLGTAVLASDLPPLVEVTDNGKFGMLFASDDVRALQSALLSATNDLLALDAIAAAAKSRMESQRSWNKIGLLTAAAYRQVLSRSHPGPTGNDPGDSANI